jgi:hypothetical protein
VESAFLGPRDLKNLSRSVARKIEKIPFPVKNKKSSGWRSGSDPSGTAGGTAVEASGPKRTIWLNGTCPPCR